MLSNGVGGSGPPPVFSSATSSFAVTIRPLRTANAQGTTYTAKDPREALEQAVAADVSKLDEPLMTWRDPREAVALDFDRPEQAGPIQDHEIPSLVPFGGPNPLFAWVTHGGGLRVLFTKVGDVPAVAIAGVWLMLAPLGPLASWRLEVKTDSRHPRGLRDSSTCGTICSFAPSAEVSLRGGIADAGEDEVIAWLTERGLSYGRYGTEACPWACGAASGNPPVEINDWGVTCFRCKHSAPWSKLVGRSDGSRTALYTAARKLVHLGHQQHVIGAAYPFLPTELIAPSWRLLLMTVNGDRLGVADAKERAAWTAKLARAASPGLDIARAASGAWLDSTTLTPRTVSADKTLKFLPWVQRPWMIDKAQNAGPLEGFTPLVPLGPSEVIAPNVLPPQGAIFVRRPRIEDDPPPVDVRCRPNLEELETAWQVMEAALPGLCRGYHFGIVVAMLIGQRGVGTPPMIFATGQSGSAKTGQVHLAASALGSKASQIVLGSTDDTTRKTGLALEAGAGAVFVDEVGRVESVFTKLEPILSANSELPYRAKYANERRVPMRCAVLLLGSTLPYAVVKSPELARRGVGYRLGGADKQWALIDVETERKLDLSEARRIKSLRSALDLITAAAWWAVHDLGVRGDWRRLLIEHHGAAELPNLDLVDDDGAARTEAILALYEAFRTAKPNELGSLAGRPGWLSADHGTRAGLHLEVLVELNADRPRFLAEASDLERLNLAPILGFSSPQLQLLVRRRSSRTLVKFVEIGAMRGHGTDRERLPAAVPANAAGTADRGNEEAVVV